MTWINTHPGVPPLPLFRSTNSEGTPITIDTTQSTAYYAEKGVVKQILDSTKQLIAYGQISDLTPRTITLAATWTPMVTYTAGLASANVTTSFANGTLAIGVPGVYQLAIGMNLSFDEVNNGRQFGVRLFDVTTGSPYATTTIYVGRNVGGSTVTITVKLQVINIGDAFRLELGGFDTFTNTTRNSITFGLDAIS